jgi:hypothetical protein
MAIPDWQTGSKLQIQDRAFLFASSDWIPVACFEHLFRCFASNRFAT